MNPDVYLIKFPKKCQVLFPRWIEGIRFENNLPKLNGGLKAQILVNQSLYLYYKLVSQSVCVCVSVCGVTLRTKPFSEANENPDFPPGLLSVNLYCTAKQTSS